MRARVQKWGNSLALRIPKSFAAEINLNEDTWVDMKLADGRLIISPEAQAGQSLEDILISLTGQSEVLPGKQVQLQSGQKFQVLRYGDRIELIPVRPMQEARGFARGIDTTVEREPDRL